MTEREQLLARAVRKLMRASRKALYARHRYDTVTASGPRLVSAERNLDAAMRGLDDAERYAEIVLKLL